MPLLVLIVILIQGFCLYHASQTGKAQHWMFILLLLPGIGSAAYFFVEILPEMASTRRGQRVVGDIATVLDPDREYRERRAQVELSGLKRQQIQAQGDIANAEAGLNTWMGQPVDVSPQIPGTPTERTFQIETQDVLIQRAIERRPDYANAVIDKLLNWQFAADNLGV